MKKYLFAVLFVILALTTVLMIFFIDTSHQLSLQVAGISFFYSFSIFLFIFYSFNSGPFYPKPIYYCTFPVTQMDFWKINLSFFLSKRLSLLPFVVPLAFLFVDFNRLVYFTMVSFLLLLELLFVFIMGAWLFHWLEARNQKALFIQLPLYSAFLFYYPASRFENFWPLLFNPLGSFILAPIVLADEPTQSLLSLFIIVAIISLILIVLFKRRMKWLI